MNQEQKLLQALLENEKVQNALKFIEEDEANSIEEQIDLTCIEAPTFHEENKGKKVRELFERYGLCDIQEDEVKNAIGFMKGCDPKDTYIMEAHMDTVFPLGTVTQRPEIIDGVIHCPGICDNTRGVEIVLSCIRAIGKAGIKLKNNVLFSATAREEGAGSCGGMRQLLKDYPDVKACLCIDGGGFTDITYNATGVITKKFTIHGKDGHSFGAYGQIAISTHALGRAIAKIAEIDCPLDPRSCLAVTSINGGSFEGLHAIPKEISFIINYRSSDPATLKRLDEEVEAAVKAGCDEENKKWNKEDITYSVEQLCYLDAGVQDKDTPLVRAFASVIENFGKEPHYSEIGCCNSNAAIGIGIPAVALGGGMEGDQHVHSLDECFQIKDAYRTVQAALLVLLLMVGTEDNPSIYD